MTRNRPRAQVTTTGADVLLDGRLARPDATRNGWAHFAYRVVTVHAGLVDHIGYDAGSSRYRTSYVDPPSYRLWMDAVDGMLHGAGTMPRSLRVRREPAPPRPGNVSLPLTQPLTPPLGDRDHGGSDDSTPLIPDDVVAFRWTVTGPAGFSQRVISHRGAQLRAAAEVTIPDQGNYMIELRVYFDDGTFAEQSSTFTLRDFLVVSIGDSFASGEGNPDSPGRVDDGGWKCDAASLSINRGWEPDMQPRATWVEPRAHRSLNNMHAFAAHALHRVHGRTLDAGRSRVSLDRITFVSAARSGAKVSRGLFDAQIQPPHKDFVGVGQIEEVRRTVAGRRIHALLVSIGGNDIGFAGVLQDLISGDNVFTANDDNNPAAVRARIDAELVQLETNLDRLHADVDRLLRPSEVYLNGYPTRLFDKTMPNGSVRFHACGVFQGWDLDIDPADYALIIEKGTQLNNLLKRKARQFGWHFLDIAPEFAGRGYCDGRSLWVAASTSCRNQGDFDGTMHPTREGHQLAAGKLVPLLRRHSVPPLRGPQPDPVTPDPDDPVLGRH